MEHDEYHEATILIQEYGAESILWLINKGKYMGMHYDL